MLSICENSHETIVVDSRSCPLCSIMLLVDEKETEIRMLNKRIDLMEREIEDMDEEINFLKDKLKKGE